MVKVILHVFAFCILCRKHIKWHKIYNLVVILTYEMLRLIHLSLFMLESSYE